MNLLRRGTLIGGITSSLEGKVSIKLPSKKEVIPPMICASTPISVEEEFFPLMSCASKAVSIKEELFLYELFSKSC